MWSTTASWVALLVLSAALTRYYNPDLFNKLTGQGLTRPETKDPAQKTAAKHPKTKRAHASRPDITNSSAPTSATEGKATKRRKLVSAPIDDRVVVTTTAGHEASLPRDEDGGMSNAEFAQQLAKAQTGTKLEPSESQASTKKGRRAAKKVAHGKQANSGPSGLDTENSSTTGRDADDDLSPVGSPSTGPISTAPTSRAGDVSDMLETPAAKPTTLRLTDVKEKSSPKPASKAFEPVLSKKQRQRQAKAAEQKALREEADRIHEAKKQQQLRTARLAEGTSNQTKANSFVAKQTAWQAGKPSTQKSVLEPPKAEVAPLLDTFDTGATLATKTKSDVRNGAVGTVPLSDITNEETETANATAVRHEVGKKETSALAASSRERLSRPVLQAQPSWADEVNEEEQDKWANELTKEEKWESVTSKKGKKKAKKDNDTSSEASSSFVRPSTATLSKPVTNGSKENGVKPRIESANRFQYIEPVVDPSFKDAEWEA